MTSTAVSAEAIFGTLLGGSSDAALQAFRCRFKISARLKCFLTFSALKGSIVDAVVMLGVFMAFEIVTTRK